MAEDSSKDIAGNAFSVFIRVKPLNVCEENPSESAPMIRVADNQISVRDPGPLGDYLVFRIAV